MEKVEVAPFRPWLVDLKLFGLSALIAVFAGVLAVQFNESSLLIYFICTLVTFAFSAVYFLKKYMRRVHGKASEGKALRRLEAILFDGWTLESNVVLPSGDLDGLLRGPGGQVYALEIKSKASLRIVKGSLWRKDKLVDVKGRPVDTKLYSQAHNNAFQVNGTPVLWFPDAKEVAFSNDIEQVIVVCGPSAHLLKVLGIPKKSWWSK